MTDRTPLQELLAIGASKRLLLELQVDLQAPLLDNFDSKVRAIGQHLVSRGLSDEWVEVFQIAFPDAGSWPNSDALEFLETGDPNAQWCTTRCEKNHEHHYPRADSD